MGLALLWAVLLQPVGFLIVTPVLMAIVLRLMNVRSPGRLFLFPFFFTIVVWLGFAQALGVTLPYGPLTSLARSWGLLY